MKKAIVAIVILALAGVVVWQVVVRARLAAEAGPAQRARGATPVSVAEIQRQTVRDVQLFTGTLLPRSQFVVAPKIAGRLERLTVDIGDRVNSGQLLAVLDDDEYARQEEMAQAELEVAEANVEEWLSTQALVARELQRVRTLREKQIASVADLDTAEAQARSTEAKYRVALAQVDQRKAALRAAQIRRSYTRIAPEWSAGAPQRVVGERFVNQSDTLRANDPIITLLDVSVLTAVIGVTERNYARMHLGQAVQIRTDAHGERVFEGRVARIAPVVRERSREARVEIEIDNSHGLLVPGLFVRAEVEFQRQENVVTVPTEAIVRRGDHRGIFLADTENNTATFVPLTFGIVEQQTTQVLTPENLSGLVVILGQHLLDEHGSAIRLPPQPSAGRPAAPDGESPGGTEAGR